MMDDGTIQMLFKIFAHALHTLHLKLRKTCIDVLSRAPVMLLAQCGHSSVDDIYSGWISWLTK